MQSEKVKRVNSNRGGSAEARNVNNIVISKLFQSPHLSPAILKTHDNTAHPSQSNDRISNKHRTVHVRIKPAHKPSAPCTLLQTVPFSYYHL